MATLRREAWAKAVLSHGAPWRSGAAGHLAGAAGAARERGYTEGASPQPPPQPLRFHGLPGLDIHAMPVDEKVL